MVDKFHMMICDHSLGFSIVKVLSEGSVAGKDLSHALGITAAFQVEDPDIDPIAVVIDCLGLLQDHALKNIILVQLVLKLEHSLFLPHFLLMFHLLNFQIIGRRNLLSLKLSCSSLSLLNFSLGRQSHIKDRIFLSLIILELSHLLIEVPREFLLCIL